MASFGPPPASRQPRRPCGCRSGLGPAHHPRLALTRPLSSDRHVMTNADATWRSELPCAEGTASRPRAPQAMPSVTSTERLCRLSSHLQPRSQLCGAVGAAGEVQPRARDLGVPFAGEPGSTNSIVDVPAPVFRVNCIMLAPSRLLDVIGFLVPAGGGGRCWALHDHTRRE